MEKLLEEARKVSDKAEIYSVESRGDSVSFEDSHLKDIDSSMQSGISLRIIKNNTLGFAYTRNLISRDGLVQNAVDSLKGGVEGRFDLPLTKDSAPLATYDTSIDTLTNSEMVDECRRVCDILSRKTKGQINVSAYRSVRSLRIMNSTGTDLSMRSSAYMLNAQILYPYTSASLNRSIESKSFQQAPDDYLDYLADMYNRSAREAVPEEKKLKVMFLPETVYVLTWRLQASTSGLSIYQNISPVAGKTGEKIFDEKLTVYNDPLDDSLPGARSFDDEGTPCRRFPVVEKGVLKNFYYDLYFARKLKAFPTGHGYKGSISSRPVPALNHLAIATGGKSFSELIRSIDNGIIVAGALGAHSGNIPNGDFSVGVSPALYVENGEISGHVKDVMVAGNIYETLTSIAGIENTLHPGYGGKFPSLLFDNIRVTIKK